jgi:hypothetical protein
MADTIIAFPKQKGPRPVEPLQGTGFKLPGTAAPSSQGSVRSDYSGSATAVLIEIDKLYPAEENSKSELIAALGLLADAISFLEQARISAREKKLIDSDRYSQRFQALLGPLFAKRKIGDGFGSTINSLHFAMINQHGKPVTFEQLTTIWRVLRELRSAPYISFDQSLKWVEEFEECKLKVDPPVLTNLIEEFEGE